MELLALGRKSHYPSSAHVAEETHDRLTPQGHSFLLLCPTAHAPLSLQTGKKVVLNGIPLEQNHGTP
ncbi:MAG: hypothetical protein N2441_09325 [Rhodocyclaceae bacterium]|nr:hypothetical protein [Rhodocyclaceae bacterium]